MIDWQSVFFNGFWLLGLALLLAAFSYYYWLAGQAGRSLRLTLNSRDFLRFFWISFICIGIGLAGTSQRIWEVAIWILFTLFSIFNIVKLGR
jgi:hypothetical protein